LQVAVPLIISSGSLSMMHVVDRIYLTWWSVDALAASLPAGITFWMVIGLPMGIAVYVNTFVAQYDGAGRKARVVAAIWQGAYFAVISGLLLSCLVPFTESLFAWMGHAPVVQRLEADYFSVMLWGAAPMMLAAVLSAFFSGRGQTQVVMYVNVFVALLNVVLDYVMIFGISGLVPAGGVKGAAWATVLSQATSALLFAWLIYRECRDEGYPLWEQRGWDRSLTRRMLWYGLPNGLQYLADIAGFTVFIALVGQIGPEELAATNLAFNLNSLAFVPMIGMGTAVMTLVGRRIGEGRPGLAVRTTWLAFSISGGLMAAFALLYLTAPGVILAPYGIFSKLESFDTLQATVIVLLRFVALYSFFDAMAVVFGAAVRGAGDTRFSLVFSLLTAWLLMVLPVYLAVQWETLTLMVAWWAVTGYIFVVGLGFLWRFQQGQWKAMQVIEQDPKTPSEMPGDIDVIADSPDSRDARPCEQRTGSRQEAASPAT
jgi:MATE family multidrug resistance protein